MIEQFFENYEHTISAIGAFLTFLAVVISLWVTALNSHAHRTRVKAAASIRLILVREIPKEEWPHYFVIKVTNVGIMRAKLDSNCLHWKVPFGKQAMMIIPYDTRGDQYAPAKVYPLIVEPNESVMIYATTLSQYEAMFQEKFIGTGISKFLASFMYLSLMTVDGRKFRVKMDNEVKSHIKIGTRLFQPKGKKDDA